jgi:aquaporin Z
MLVQGWAVMQLWMFWVAPIVGAVGAGVVYKSCFEAKSAD